MPRTHSRNFRLDDTSWRRWQATARRLNITTSDLIRLSVEHCLQPGQLKHVKKQWQRPKSSPTYRR